MISPHLAQEQEAAEAFTKQSLHFDELYSQDLIVQYKRQRVRDHVNHLIRPASKMLELNAGTGEDAVYFASRGHTVHATDVSEGMQKVLREKVYAENLQNRISIELCSFTELDRLKNKGPYDIIFSNFAGLNCTSQLDKVLRSFSPLLEPGGFVTLVVLPKFCLWETLLLFKGKFKTAFRRFFTARGRKAHLEGRYFLCWYYNASFIRKILGTGFETICMEGLCTIVPPSYIENFGAKHPSLFRRLKKLEDKWKTRWPWQWIGDYYIISLRKKG